MNATWFRRHFRPNVRARLVLTEIRIVFCFLREVFLQFCRAVGGYITLTCRARRCFTVTSRFAAEYLTLVEEQRKKLYQGIFWKFPTASQIILSLPCLASKEFITMSVCVVYNENGRVHAPGAVRPCGTIHRARGPTCVRMVQPGPGRPVSWRLNLQRLYFVPHSICCLCSLPKVRHGRFLFVRFSRRVGR